jgi:HAD superfamily hydrolase (TIGR01509 family)
MKKYNFRCLVFDMDGTLVQTIQLICDSFNHVAEKYAHRRYSAQEIIALFGPPEEDVVRAIVGEERTEEAMEEYLKYYRSRHKKCAKLHHGMDKILERCKEQNKILAVFTGKGRETTKITLEECGIEKYFDMVVTGDDVKNHKPSSEGLKMIMERYSLKPEETLMVGDAPVDVQAAHSAGAKIAAVVWDSYAKDVMVQLPADFLFHSVKEFQQWLDEEMR